MKRTLYTAQSRTKFFLILLSVVFATGLLAQPAATLSVQGVLTRSDGTAVDDGTYTVSFKLFDAPTGGNQVHSESIDVETIGGVYSVILGANPNSPLTAQFNTIYYLSVTVGSSELTPRPRLTHAPYALSLIGQNNTFPSTGAVIADAVRAKGGPPTGGQSPTANGFSFHTTGDGSGGMFSEGANNIELWAGAAKKIKLSSTENEIYGQTVNFGAFISNAQTVNGNETVNGNSTVTGTSQTNGKVLTNFEAAGGGYSFVGDGAFDSGLFGKFDGELAIKANGTDRILIGGNGVNYLSGTNVMHHQTSIHGQLFLGNVPHFDGKNMQWNENTGLVGADNSTRRSKYNIKTLEDDFSLILKSTPRTYTRKVDPDHWEVGYIAEEMDSLGLTKLVEYDKEGRPDGYNYEKMILYVTEVLKIQHADIEAMKAEIAALKVENAQLQTSNASLQSENVQLQTTLGKQLDQLAKRLDLLENHQGAQHRK